MNALKILIVDNFQDQITFEMKVINCIYINLEILYMPYELFDFDLMTSSNFSFDNLQ